MINECLNTYNRNDDMKEYNNNEFYDIINPILQNEEFLKLKEITHHGITRFDHSMRVAYFSYKVTKLLRLDYQETAVAALLHDFFTDEVKEKFEKIDGVLRVRVIKGKK